MSGQVRATEAVVDLDAVAHNVATLGAAAGGTPVCAVVKADAYGHGADAVAATARAAGAAWLAVATVEEADSVAARLRKAHPDWWIASGAMLR